MRQRTWKSAFDRGHVELNVIPLIDVVFFLLVFYVISTSFAPEASLAIERPVSAQAQTIAGDFLTVAVTASGQIQIGPQSTDLAGLPALVAAALHHGNTLRVLVIADRSLPTGVLLGVMDACSAAGAAEVEVAATREGG